MTRPIVSRPSSATCSARRRGSGCTAKLVSTQPCAASYDNALDNSDDADNDGRHCGEKCPSGITKDLGVVVPSQPFLFHQPYESESPLFLVIVDRALLSIVVHLHFAQPLKLGAPLGLFLRRSHDLLLCVRSRSLAILAAMRRASSFVSGLAATRRPGSSS
jgi:hypothetical protein